MRAERGFELRGGRHHEMKLDIRLGEFALQIEKIRARNMPGLEGVLSGHGKIGKAALRGRGPGAGREFRYKASGVTTPSVV